MSFELDALEAYVARTGDTVILNYPNREVSMEIAEVIKKKAMAVLPKGVKVLIVSGAQVLIARGDTEGDPTP